MISTGIRPSLTVRLRRPPAMEDAKTDFRPPEAPTSKQQWGLWHPKVQPSLSARFSFKIFRTSLGFAFCAS